MPRPSTIQNPTKVTINLPGNVHETGKSHAAALGISFSSFVSELIRSKTSGKQVLPVDLPQEEYDALQAACAKHGITPNELISRSCRSLLGS